MARWWRCRADHRAGRVACARHERAFAKGASAEIEVKQSRITVEQDQKRLDIQRQRVTAIRTNIEAQLRAEEARRDEAASALDIARQQVDSLGVRAGIDGILQQVDVEPGQQIAGVRSWHAWRAQTT